MKVRTRIAPSPTGDPHVGTAYIALFNYAFAKNQGGEFICRIEDTDQQRSKPWFEKSLFEAFDWLGFTFDDVEKQSLRLEAYQTYMQLLFDKGMAYVDNGAVRLKSSGEPIVVNDGLRGNITFEDYQKDPVLIKSDGWPTYHFANVIDDHLMEITHVIRGEEWIVSTPIHLELYRAFEWEPPKFYHLSLLRNPDRSKLSKRKNPTSILYYRDLGYLPEVLLRYLGTLGFSTPGGKEIDSVDEMIELFDWSRVSINGPVFDIDKLKAFNKEALTNKDFSFDTNVDIQTIISRKFAKVWALAAPRITTVEEVITEFRYCFGEEVKFDVAEIGLGREILETFLKELESSDFTQISEITKAFFQSQGIKPKDWYPTLNVIITGKRSCPPVFDVMQIIGKEITKRRIKRAIEML